MDGMINKIVLTGGPCAGKTTALARIVDHFSEIGYYVLTVPEAATLFSLSGVDFQTLDTSLFIESERQLMEFQMELEDRMTRIAAKSGRKSLIVCDRGTMDLKAYLTAEQWEELLKAIDKTVVEIRDARYEAVIHMATAAKGAVQYYTYSNNAARTETPEQACAVDDRLMAAWTGHPHLRVVGNDCGFEEKINRVLSEISQVLGVPQPIEIERKYLVRQTGDIPNGNISDITQTYLLPFEGRERRLRRRGEDGHFVYFLTTKIRIADDRSYEHEQQISEAKYDELMTMANPEKGSIHKKRCCFIWENQYFELDTFLNPPLEYQLLEIEDAENPEEVSLPPFLKVYADVTGDPQYSNSNIAKRVLK